MPYEYLNLADPLRIDPDAYHSSRAEGGWQPGDPVHAPQPEWATCKACGTAVLWHPDMPNEIQCPECDGTISTRAEGVP
jgi:hypothetical protein